VRLDGELIQQANKPDIRDNISAVALRGRQLVVAADEGADILLFERASEQQYRAAKPPCIAVDGRKCGSRRKGAEADIEGLAWGRDHLYAIGSHSRARNKAKKKKSLSDNLQRLQTIKHEPSREALFRLPLDRHGKLSGAVERISLQRHFADHPLLARFQPIPSKENGIDIEGLAVRQFDGEDQVYLGFRGPVLRGNRALVMRLRFRDGKFSENDLDSQIFYLNLGGRGIRGMTSAGDDGLLILAGPVSDALIDDPAQRYPVYLWDGRQHDLRAKPMTPLCHIAAPNGSKAEGIELINRGRTSGDPYRLLLVFDGAEKGAPTIADCGN